METNQSLYVISLEEIAEVIVLLRKVRTTADKIEEECLALLIVNKLNNLPPVSDIPLWRLLWCMDRKEEINETNKV